MPRLISLILQQRTLIVGLLVAYVCAGVAAFRRLPIEAYPDVTNLQTQVITLWPGHAAEEIEKFLTVPVENQLNSIPQRASLRSISLFGLSVVTIVFEDEADGFRSRLLVSQQLAQVTLPAGAQAAISPDATPVGEIYRYTLQAPPGFPATELRALEDWVVERQFRTVAGVVDVVGFGGPTRQYQVLVDPLRLKALNLPLKTVVDALAVSNKNAGGAYIERGTQMFIVRGLGLIGTLDDIRATVLAVRNGTPIKVSDVAIVQSGFQTRLGRVGLNKPIEGVTVDKTDRDDVVQGIVLLRKGENALDVVERVAAKAEEINRTYLPPGVKLVPHYNRKALIDRTLETVRQNMIEGIALVLLVLITFLGVRHWRSALVVAAVIPLALLGAFALLDLQHIPANLISMGAIDFGIIVDAAVVIIENILHRRDAEGRTIQDAIVEGAGQVARPLLFSKVVLLAAFLPLFTLQRVEGRIFRPMALTLSFAIIVGTILALVVVPVLASFFVRSRAGSGESGRPAHLEPWIVRQLRRAYLPLLQRVLARPIPIIAGGAVALGLALLVGSRLGSEFLPKLEEGSLWVHLTLPGSISPTEAARLTGRARRVLAGFAETRIVVTQIGRPDDGTDIGGFEQAEILVDLRPPAEWKVPRTREALCAAMNEQLQIELPGCDLLFSQVIEDNVNEAVSGLKGEMGVKIFGPDADVLQRLADHLARILREVPGAVDVAAEQLAGQPQVQVSVNRASVARFGLAVADVNTVVETAFGGAIATTVIEGERSFDLAVKLDPTSITSPERIREIPIFGSAGELLTLGRIADVETRNGFARIYREENSRRVAAKFAVRGRDLGSVVREAQSAVAEHLKLPNGYRLQWAGNFESQQRALARLAVVVPITLAIIGFLLYTAFRNARYTLLVLLGVPLSAIGGIVGLALAGLPLSVSALAGFVALFGASVQNGVILLEQVRDYLILKVPRLEAIREGASARLRAVLMTSAMAAFGLLPAALSHAVGAETARPFAVVIVGGLVSSTLLTLFVLPAVCVCLLPPYPVEPERNPR